MEYTADTFSWRLAKVEGKIPAKSKGIHYCEFSKLNDDLNYKFGVVKDSLDAITAGSYFFSFI